jgi:hypothetical protein
MYITEHCADVSVVPATYKKGQGFNIGPETVHCDWIGYFTML